MRQDKYLLGRGPAEEARLKRQIANLAPDSEMKRIIDESEPTTPYHFAQLVLACQNFSRLGFCWFRQQR